MSPNQNKLQLFKVPQIESIQDMLLKSVDKYSNKLAMKILWFTGNQNWLIILHNGMEKNFRNLFAVLIFWFFCIKTKEQ